MGKKISKFELYHIYLMNIDQLSNKTWEYLIVIT